MYRVPFKVALLYVLRSEQYLFIIIHVVACDEDTENLQRGQHNCV